MRLLIGGRANFLRELEDLNIPRLLFLNKIDKANKRVRETLATLQPASRVPLVLRQIPIWNGDLIAGFVDLALERAFIYREHMASEVVALEGGGVPADVTPALRRAPLSPAPTRTPRRAGR